MEYDPAYFTIDYPNGDVPIGKGVCTDVVIRPLGLDLQQKVHEDMLTHFDKYPKLWQRRKNIDHRRVQGILSRFGVVKAKFYSSEGLYAG